MRKSLDAKLAQIHADPSGCKDFILADAKDADMALGIAATGRAPEAQAGETRCRSLSEFRAQVEEIVRQGLVDIMLMSASTSELLTIQRRIFDDSPVTPAARVNDTTDIHVIRGGQYARQSSLSFGTTTLDHIRCGRRECAPEDGGRGPNLGLYSITLNNDAGPDRETLEAYKRFRLEAEAKGFRHFLEVFDPNVPGAVAPENLAGFVNDAIVRTLAGVTAVGRPQFLKVVYHGPKALEELVSYDPHLVIGILGGAGGTTYDAFKLLSEARKYGARAALFGRKINQAENQLAFVSFLRLIADGELSPEEAVRAYHGVLQQLGIRPLRGLAEDLELHTPIISDRRRGVGSSAAANSKSCGSARCRCGCSAKENAAKACVSGGIASDFRAMTPAEKIAYHKARWDRVFD